MALYDKAIVRVLPAVPRPVVKRLSSRYIAGETVEDAVAGDRDPTAGTKTATIDDLGEEISSDAEAEGIVGPAVTPWLLARIAEITDGRSVPANTALIVNNARVAAQLAAALLES